MPASGLIPTELPVDKISIDKDKLSTLETAMQPVTDFNQQFLKAFNSGNDHDLDEALTKINGMLEKAVIQLNLK